MSSSRIRHQTNTPHVCGDRWLGKPTSADHPLPSPCILGLGPTLLVHSSLQPKQCLANLHLSYISGIYSSVLREATTIDKMLKGGKHIVNTYNLLVVVFVALGTLSTAYGLAIVGSTVGQPSCMLSSLSLAESICSDLYSLHLLQPRPSRKAGLYTHDQYHRGYMHIYRT